MNTINVGPSHTYQTLVPSYTPLGKPVAGLESPENRDQTLPPVEETSASEKNRNQPDQKAAAVSGDDQGGNGKSDKQADELTEAEQQQARELGTTDREVRAHEAAHQAVGGSLAGAASFRFVIGPDGERYAVGGEVPIVLTTLPDDPEATLRNAEQVRAAALAPAQPSNRDRQVAVAAAQLIAQAQLQIALQRTAAINGDSAKSSDAGGATSNTDRATNSNAVASFSAAAGQTLAPGSLLDQRS